MLISIIISRPKINIKLFLQKNEWNPTLPNGAPGSIYLKGEGSAVGRRGQVKNRKKHTAIPIAQSQYRWETLNVTKALKTFLRIFLPVKKEKILPPGRTFSICRKLSDYRQKSAKKGSSTDPLKARNNYCSTA